MKQPQKYIGTFPYAGQHVEFSFWLLQADDRPPDTIIFLGAGQVGSIPRRIAATAGTGVVVIDGLPHWKAHPSGRDTAQFAAAYVQTAFKVVQKTFGADKLNIIAESQAVPASVLLIHRLSSSIRNVVLARPLGFTAKAFGSTDHARLKTFQKRLLKTAAQLVHHPHNIAIGVIMLRAMFREPNLAAFHKKYTVGISYDLLQDYHQALQLQKDKGHSLTLLLAEKDRLFPPHEILAAVSSLSPAATVKIVPKIGHASLASPSSKVMLRQAISIVRESIV